MRSGTNKTLRGSVPAASYLGTHDQKFLRAAPREVRVNAEIALLCDPQRGGSNDPYKSAAHHC